MSEEESPPYGGEKYDIPEWAKDWPIPEGMTAYQRDVLAMVSRNLRKGAEEDRKWAFIRSVYLKVDSGAIFIRWMPHHHSYELATMIATNGYVIPGPHSVAAIHRQEATGEMVEVDTSWLPLFRASNMSEVRDRFLGVQHPLVEHPHAWQHSTRAKREEPVPDEQLPLEL